jgi:16S rRNA (cytidine1402-2'-O)-methyltransferase
MIEKAAAHPEAESRLKPALYVVATPIGNLRDITFRAVETLRQVDCIAAEDTRVTGRLLSHYGIASKLLAVHEHNERRVIPQILQRLEQGAAVALVSDAGTPAISDPGAALVAAVLGQGYPVIPLPGPSAVIAALSVAGFVAPHFLFYGFLPARAAQRASALRELSGYPFTLVFYEAPHRAMESVIAMRDALGGERRVVIARELTKLFESFHHGTLAEAVEWLETHPEQQRGEFVLVVAGAEAGRNGAAEDGGERVLKILLEELPVKQAAQLAAKISGGRRNALYDAALRLKAGKP